MTPLAPQASIGILGGGQLARMLALEARRMDYRTLVVDPDGACSASGAADEHLCARFDDPRVLDALRRRTDVVTLDNEQVPVDLVRDLERLLPMRPGAGVLHTLQDRLRQREFLDAHGFAQTAYRAVGDRESLERAFAALGGRCVLKTRTQGYDGRGQWQLQSMNDVESAWRALRAKPAVLEAHVAFDMELAVTVARDQGGAMESFPVVENVHRNHQLAFSVVPARTSGSVQERATKLAERIAEALGVVGLCTTELFLTAEGRLLVNEVAARAHNSGHFSLGASDISQFEQQLRAICGLPLARPRLLSAAVMLNLYGDLWRDGAPRWERVLSVQGMQLHLYGKDTPRPGRKMGHLLWLGNTDPDRLLREVQGALTDPRARPLQEPLPTAGETKP